MHALGIQPGDTVEFDIPSDRKRIVVRKYIPLDAEFHAALESSLSEWSSKEDDEAFHDL